LAGLTRLLVGLTLVGIDKTVSRLTWDIDSEDRDEKKGEKQQRGWRETALVIVQTHWFLRRKMGPFDDFS